MWADVKVSHEDLYSFLHCAVQYAVGRRSYITSTVADQVRRYWHHLDINEQRTLTRNLRADLEVYARAEKLAGDACDDQSWRDLLEWCEAKVRAAA